MTRTARPSTARRSLLLFAIAALALLVARPASAQDGPRPDAPNGRTITLTNDTTTPGGTITFTGSGYVNEGGTGQVVTVKLNDLDILGDVKASDDGNLSGSVTIPASITPGGTYWLRFLSGTGQENDMPPSSVHAMITVKAGQEGDVIVEAEVTTTTRATEVGGVGDPTGGGTSDPTGSTGPTGGTSGPTASELPNNGLDADQLRLLAGGLVVAGLLAVAFESRLRRRRTHAIER